MTVTTAKQATKLEQRLRWAGLAIILGLLINGLALCWIHPLAFLSFAGLSTTLVLAGIAVYLISIVSDSLR